MSCYSIGQSKRSTEWKNNSHLVPGPGSYDPSKPYKICPPSWKIGQASRDGLYMRSANPGPGSYEVPEKITKEGPKYHFGLKTAYVGPKSNAPGPGAYDPKTFEPKAPKYTLSSRTYVKDARLSAPGPGAYEYKSTLNVPAAKIGSSQRENFFNKNEAPGPGAYESTRPYTAAPKYGFGSSTRDGNMYDQLKAMPGPGSYEIKGAINTNKGVTITSRKDTQALKEASKIPGPGSYDPDLRLKKHYGNVRIGSANRDSLNKELIKTPGPGAYDARFEAVKNKEPGVKMGTSIRRPLSANPRVPGPGSYEIPSKMIEGPKFGMHGQKEDNYKKMKDLTYPGPGNYNPETKSIFERAATPQIGTSNRGDFHIGGKNPGPGMYELGSTLAGPRWGFGSGMRANMGKGGNEPGPGSYNIPPKFADVPKYLLPNGSKYKL